MVKALHKDRILIAMVQKGYQERDVKPILDQLKDEQLVAVLGLIRDLRRDVFWRNIHPVLTRAALKFALFADKKAIRDSGKDLLFYDHLTDLILIQLLEASKS